MQLVPILSTIILVGTIATFILAVAAYVLYKIRERRAREEGVARTQFVQEPHVLVAPQQTTLAVPVQQAPATSVFVAPGVTAPQTSQAAPAPAVVSQAPAAQDSLFWEYTDEGFVPVQPEEPASQADTQEQEEDEGFAWL